MDKDKDRDLALDKELDTWLWTRTLLDKELDTWLWTRTLDLFLDKDTFGQGAGAGRLAYFGQGQ